MLFERSVISAIIRTTPVKVSAIDIRAVNGINEHVCHNPILAERENLLAFLCKVPKLHINLGTFPEGRLGNSFVRLLPWTFSNAFFPIKDEGVLGNVFITS